MAGAMHGASSLEATPSSARSTAGPGRSLEAIGIDEEFPGTVEEEGCAARIGFNALGSVAFTKAMMTKTPAQEKERAEDW